MKLNVQLLNKDARMPSYANAGDAGMDLYTVSRMVIKPKQLVAVPTGIAMALPRGTVGLIWDKSGLAIKHGLKVMGGVIDSSYRGEVQVGIINLGTKAVTLEAGHKVAQMLIQKVEHVSFKQVVSLSTTKRGAKGFGSSGK
ncbi:MAG: dUTP diphosphatase [Patescibacteria group bacterium]